MVPLGPGAVMTHPGPPEMLQKNMILYFLFSLGFFSFFFPKSGWFYEISADSEYESLLLTDTRHVFIASVKAIMKLCCWIQLHCKFQKKPKWGSNEVFFFIPEPFVALVGTGSNEQISVNLETGLGLAMELQYFDGRM